jgi:hypothetical protein
MKTTMLPMQNTKVKLGLYLDKGLDRQLRVLAAEYGRPISEIHEAVLKYCLGNRNFLGKLNEMYKTEVDF